MQVTVYINSHQQSTLLHQPFQKIESIQYMASLSGQPVMHLIRAFRISNKPELDLESKARKRIFSELETATREPVPFVSFRVEHDDFVCISAAYLL
jgi:hypothetical protein